MARRGGDGKMFFIVLKDVGVMILLMLKSRIVCNDQQNSAFFLGLLYISF